MMYKIIIPGPDLKSGKRGGSSRRNEPPRRALVNNYAGSGDLQSPPARQDVNPFCDVRSKVLSSRASLFFINNYAGVSRDHAVRPTYGR